MTEIHFSTHQGTHGILTMGLPLESPAIRRGCRARRVWRYFYRMDRIEASSKKAGNARRLTMSESMSYGAAIVDTMEHLYDEGVDFIEPDDDYTACFWKDTEGRLDSMLRRIAQP